VQLLGQRLSGSCLELVPSLTSNAVLHNSSGKNTVHIDGDNLLTS
jgi:hypothetical protein